MVSRVIIEGPAPPTNGESVVDTLRPRYSKALLLVLAARHDGRFENVRTVALYGSHRLNVAPDRVRIIPSARTVPEVLLCRRLLTASDMDAFISRAQSGSATLPSSAHTVNYRIDSWWEGFLAPSTREGHESPSGTTSIWRRRRQAHTPTVAGVVVDRTSLLGILEKLPAIDDVDWSLVDPRGDVSALDGLDELYPGQVRLQMRHQGTHLVATVEDPDSWLTGFASATIRVEGRRFTLRQRAVSVDVSGRGTYTVPLSEPYTDVTLEADGIPLDAFSGTYVGVTQSVPPMSGGSLPNVYSLTKMRLHFEESSASSEDVVIDHRKRDDAWVSSQLRRVVSVAGANASAPGVDILDKYEVTAKSLRALAGPLAAGSLIRIGCNGSNADSDFRSVESATGVRVERYRLPSGLALHDRYMRVGSSIWIVGASFNNLGANFATIVAIRELLTLRQIADLFDECLTGAPEATS